MRKKLKEVRHVLSDFKYKSIWITKLINSVMKHGKRNTAENIVYNVLEGLSTKLNITVLDLQQKIMENLFLSERTCSRKIGGTVLRIPKKISKEKSDNLSVKYIVKILRDRKHRALLIKQEKITTSEEILSFLLLEVYNNKGPIIELVKNEKSLNSEGRAYAHYN